MKLLISITYCLLFTLFGFLLGIQFALITGAGDDQMLAAGAIVLGYGSIGAILGLTVGIGSAIKYKAQPKRIVQATKMLAVSILVFVLYFWVQNRIRQKSNTPDRMGLIEEPIELEVLKESVLLYKG